MFRLDSEADKQKAAEILKSLEPLLPCLVPLNSFHFNVKYVDHFNKRVVYAGVYPSPELLKLAEFAQKALRNGGIYLCGNFDQFTPHLTMLKISRPFMKESGVSELNPYLFDGIQHMAFGRQRVESLRICETGRDRDPVDNFYVTVSEIHNSLLCISDRLPALVSRNLIDQMSKGIIDEEMGDSLTTEILSSTNKVHDKENSFEKGVLSMEMLLKSNQWESPKVMIILRGLPGSGKTRLAEQLCRGKPSAFVCSADDYFNNQNVTTKKKEESSPPRGGNHRYKFKGAEIETAHKHCRDSLITAIQNGTEVVIVDNTHTQRWEYRVYERLALLCGYKSYVFEIFCNSDSTRQEFQKRCTHDVSDHVHKDMYTRWERDPQSITWAMRDTGNVTLDWIVTKKEEQARCPVLYSALFLDQKSRDRLAATHPPSLKNVQMDHVTLVHAPDNEHLTKLPVGTPFRVQMSYYAGNQNAQVVSVVELEKCLERLCLGERTPHITIATANNFQPKDAHTLLLLESCLAQPTENHILTGIVGVKIAVNERESVVCTDPYYFKNSHLVGLVQLPAEVSDIHKERFALFFYSLTIFRRNRFGKHYVLPIPVYVCLKDFYSRRGNSLKKEVKVNSRSRLGKEFFNWSIIC